MDRRPPLPRPRTAHPGPQDPDQPRGGDHRHQGPQRLNTKDHTATAVHHPSGLDRKRHDLVEVADTAREAEEVRTKLLSQLDERRNPRTKATVSQLLDRYLEVVDVEPTTRKRYEGLVERHLRPALGKLKLSQLDSDVLESFYAQLRHCRERCGGRVKHVKHRTQRPHDCDACRVVACKPLSASSIRGAHWIMTASLSRAVRWRWISQSPIEHAEPPSPAKSNPSPPTPEEAARLLAEAWKDEDWGAFVWTAMTTGARRGELCALLREDLDLDAGLLRVRTGLKRIDGELVRADTKTHQQRRIALDDETVEVLRTYVERVDAQAAKLHVKVPPTAFLFTSAPDGSAPLIPDTTTQRYERMATRLGIKTTLHKLRHYSATELLAAGVDIRTVAGRLGHGGGGTTTLKVYAAWISESDQRAAQLLGSRMPKAPR